MMKSKLMIPVILLMSFMLSSFQDKVQPVTDNPCSFITSLIHNGEDLTKNYDRHLFCFHTDGVMEACNDLYCERGTWQADKNVVQIAINAASIAAENGSGGTYDWLNGTWRIIEWSETAIELEKIDKDYWRVRFETITR